MKIKRAYERPAASDGYRVLVDRLWPRGLRKESLKLDEWAKELGPSTELRKRFGHDPAKWDSFRRDFEQELRAPELRQKLRELAAIAARGTLTLVYSAHDEEHNQAVVLRDRLVRRRSTAKPRKKAA